RLDDAVRDANAVLASQPVEAHEVLARVAWARGDVDAARREVEAALAADSAARPETVLLLAEMLSRQGDHVGVLARLDPLHAEVVAGRTAALPGLEWLRGDAFARTGRNEEAERAFRAEIAAFPRDTRAYAGLAFLLAGERRFDEIDPLMQKLLQASPTA